MERQHPARRIELSMDRVHAEGRAIHWNHNGITHYEIGAGMGKGMIELIKANE